MAVGDDPQLTGARLITDCSHIAGSHLTMVHQLDDVHGRVSELFQLRFGVADAFDSPAELLGAGIRLVLEKGPGDVKRRAGDFAAVDALADVDALLERRTEIARAGYTGHE